MLDLTQTKEEIQLENSMFKIYLESKGCQEYCSTGDETADELYTVSESEKKDIAKQVLRIVEKEYTEKRVASESVRSNIADLLDERDMRIADLQRSAFDFKRKIMKGAENSQNLSEKVRKFIISRLEQQDNMVEKLRRKNITLENQIKKLETQLKQNEEEGGSLHDIDLHQVSTRRASYLMFA